MERVNRIWQSRLYQEHLKQIQSYEQDRIFCRHDVQHFLDVARIGYIYVLEHGMDVEKDEVYAFGLLHDIGRGLQYSQGIDHDVASAQLAEVILKEAGYAEAARERILRAIRFHRDSETVTEDSFALLMYKADKASRACYNCNAKSECYWDLAKKNMKIEV